MLIHIRLANSIVLRPQPFQDALADIHQQPHQLHRHAAANDRRKDQNDLFLISERDQQDFPYRRALKQKHHNAIAAPSEDLHCLKQ